MAAFSVLRRNIPATLPTQCRASCDKPPDLWHAAVLCHNFEPPHALGTWDSLMRWLQAHQSCATRLCVKACSDCTALVHHEVNLRALPLSLQATPFTRTPLPSQAPSGAHRTHSPSRHPSSTGLPHRRMCQLTTPPSLESRALWAGPLQVRTQAQSGQLLIYWECVCYT
jgi:hypothetical protein